MGSIVLQYGNIMHGSTDMALTYPNQIWVDTTAYTFQNHFHPFTGALLARLNRKGVQGLYDPDWLESLRQSFFDATYRPARSAFQSVEGEDKQLDFLPGGAYSVYNWELFLHIPVAVAVHLSESRRFAEAQRWLHLVFDPLNNDMTLPAPKRYWKFPGFRMADGTIGIDEMLTLLAKPDSALTTAERSRKQAVLLGYQQVLADPFNPHAVARVRPLAYMLDVVMRYLDNLIAWGDHLFAQDTLESINEATQLYVLASTILGDKPQQIPPRGGVRGRSYAQLRAAGLDATGNALVELEGQFPFNIGSGGAAGATANAGSAPLFGMGRTLYFCVPRNDKLLAYWDRVANRLYNIRHCLNLAGVARPLALFDPPIDPGLLVKAAAAGIDIGAAAAGLNQPAAPLTARAMIQKALDATSELRAFGAALLQAIEKTDAEDLALLRQGHELELATRQQDSRYLVWKQAEQATEALLLGRLAARERYVQSLRLLGHPPDDEKVPAALAPDRRLITADNFDEALAALVGAYDREVPLLAQADLGIEPTPTAELQEAGRLSMIAPEIDEITHLQTAAATGLAASIIKTTSAAMAFIPDINVDLHYWGIGGTSKMKLGTALVQATQIAADIVGMISAWESAQAGLAARNAMMARRADDWAHQANLAARELRQIGKQVIGSLIAEQVAYQELQNSRLQIEKIQQVQDFITAKTSGADLYRWMQAQLGQLHHDAYRFAFDLARQAEATVKDEVMRPEMDARSMIRFNYWDSGRKGLLAGETLALDLRRLEMAFHDHNRREYELTRHVSLMQIDPMAIMALRRTGRARVDIPEALFDMDGPGHYCRRIHSVALTIPAVGGPQTTISARLTLLKSSIRTTPEGAGSYARTDEDPRFRDQFGAVESVVASTAREDAGLFDASGSDGRPLPFSGRGVIATWQIDLPADPSRGDPQQFDYDSISDAVLHIRYTARDGGQALREGALAALKDAIDNAEGVGSARMFSVRLDFPMEWERLQTDPPAGQRREIALELLPEHYPFWARGRLASIQRATVIAGAGPGVAPAYVVADKASMADAGAQRDVLAPSGRFPGLATGDLANVARPDPTGKLRLYLEGPRPADLWLALTWSGS